MSEDETKNFESFIKFFRTVYPENIREVIFLRKNLDKIELQILAIAIRLVLGAFILRAFNFTFTPDINCLSQARVSL
ncbi:MAG: hypothetical protein JRD93_12345 [Deltaproteobacteria bacterium]|nr:hypothetical protein [Deltaproteobacteria bacterium]MBW2662749.1 hypothetical protein [Deltaproteobacteria bacterium]